MAIIVDVQEAKPHLSRLPDEAHAGHEAILANAGKPYARRMPLAPEPARRQPGRLRGHVDPTGSFDPLPADELDASDGR